MVVVTGLELALPSGDELMMLRLLQDATTSDPAEPAFCNPRCTPGGAGRGIGTLCYCPSFESLVVFVVIAITASAPYRGRECSAYSAGRGSDMEAIFFILFFKTAVMASYDTHFAVMN